MNSPRPKLRARKCQQEIGHQSLVMGTLVLRKGQDSLLHRNPKSRTKSCNGVLNRVDFQVRRRIMTYSMFFEPVDAPIRDSFRRMISHRVTIDTGGDSRRRESLDDLRKHAGFLKAVSYDKARTKSILVTYALPLMLLWSTASSNRHSLSASVWLKASPRPGKCHENRV